MPGSKEDSGRRPGAEVSTNRSRLTVVDSLTPELRAHVRRLVDAAPPLSAVQAARLRELLLVQTDPAAPLGGVPDRHIGRAA
jgi:hypothetical protein